MSSFLSLPTVLTLNEIERLLAELPAQDALMACLHYGAGLRVSELARLRIKDIDFERGKVIVRSSSKGNKDRVTLLPASLVPALQVLEGGADIVPLGHPYASLQGQACA